MTGRWVDCDALGASCPLGWPSQDGPFRGELPAPGDIGPGGQAEHATVLTVDPSTDTITALTGGPVEGTCGPDTSLPTSVDFCPLSGTYYTHASGDLVYDSTLYVANSAGFE